MKGLQPNMKKANFSVNNPLPKSFEEEILKCTKIIQSFIKPETGKVILDTVIPKNIIANAKGIAILTVLKVTLSDKRLDLL
jgi:lipid-binding SYLF domain-containing protein